MEGLHLDSQAFRTPHLSLLHHRPPFPPKKKKKVRLSEGDSELCV